MASGNCSVFARWIELRLWSKCLDLCSESMMNGACAGQCLHCMARENRIDRDSLPDSLRPWGLSCAGIAAFNLVFGLAFGRWASLTEARELLRLRGAEAATHKRD